MKCPICKREVEETTPQGERNRFHPYCSERCKLIDLGAWLSEQRAIPGDAPPDSDSPSTPDEDPRS